MQAQLVCRPLDNLIQDRHLIDLRLIPCCALREERGLELEQLIEHALVVGLEIGEAKVKQLHLAQRVVRHLFASEGQPSKREQRRRQGFAPAKGAKAE